MGVDSAEWIAKRLFFLLIIYIPLHCIQTGLGFFAAEYQSGIGQSVTHQKRERARWLFFIWAL